MTTNKELRNEISNCNLAIKAFRIECPWLAPDGLDAAPSIEWLKNQKRRVINQLAAQKAKQEAFFPVI
jgi:hypothetical protein